MNEYPVTIELPIQWGDMDSLGHVNNARYFTWFESARIALFREVEMATGGTPARGPILARTSCDFLAPLEWPGEITVGTRIARIGTRSFTMEYAIARADFPDRPVATGEGVVVMMDYRRGETVEIGDELRERLERYRVLPEPG